jgi:hypothetical protein
MVDDRVTAKTRRAVAMMIGLTDIGRATIAELQINRSGLINLRQAFYILGKHPPKTLLNDMMRP